MLAAGGLMALLLVGFVVDGFLSARPGEDGDDVNDPGLGDTPDGGDGDLVQGNDLAEMLFGTDGDDRIDGGGGDDTVSGGAGTDQIWGGDGADHLIGGDGADSLDGGAGDDVLILGAGDAGIGGAGADLFEITDQAVNEDGDTIAYVTDFEPGIDRLILDFDGPEDAAPEIQFDWESNPGSMLILANGTPVTLLDGVVSISSDDVEIRMSEATAPGAGADPVDPAPTPTPAPGPAPEPHVGKGLLDGGSPDDMIRARADFGLAFGPVGADALTGGIGDDMMSGTDTNDAMFGNEGHDTLSGGAGLDEIYGDQGDDVIDGGAASDFLAGGDGADQIAGGAGTDLIFGQDGDDQIAGGSGADFLQGGLGADTIDGGAGDDILDGTFNTGDAAFGPVDQDQGDILLGGDGDDTILLGAGDMAMGSDGSDTFATGPYIEEFAVAGRVEDFDPTQDTIEVVYDPDLTPDPEITIEPETDGPGAQVMLDGQVILYLNDGVGMDPAAIQLRDVTLDQVAETA